MLVKITNGLIDLLTMILNALLLLLPDTPFTFTSFDWGPLGDAIGFVFPVASMATHLAALLTAFGLYYGIRWILRIIRQIQ